MTFEFAQSDFVLSDRVLELTTGLFQMSLKILTFLLKLAYGIIATFTATETFLPFI